MACRRKCRRPGGGDARADGIASGRRRRPPARGRADERRETATRAPRTHGPGIFGCASLARRAAPAPDLKTFPFMANPWNGRVRPGGGPETEISLGVVAAQTLAARRGGVLDSARVARSVAQR